MTPASLGVEGEPEIIVIGAGAVGSSVAYHLAKAGRNVTVVEKDGGPAMHQSGRNSGVIHAGYNLKPGSNKARYCVEGSRQLRDYCKKWNIPMTEGGILVVAREQHERDVLAELHRRSKANGVASELLDGDGLREIEPHAAGVEALRAKEGASFDARDYVHHLAGQAVSHGATFLYDAKVEGISEDSDGVTVTTDKGPLRAPVIVNAAGLYADQLAGKLAKDIRVIPFRGYYAELAAPRRSLVKSHIYAAPDLTFPFLGVHLSRRADGRVIVGPGAMLAFGREAYSLMSFKGGGLDKTLSWPGFYRMMVRPEFRRLIRTEVAKSIRLKAIWKEAQLLVPELRPEDVVRSYAGNRAQLVDRKGQLVEDILVRETSRGVHVLNAVSPGLTCSLPFGKELAGQATALLK